ncbi:YebC/PmpR family DNA-binding transcriptional regulator [Aureibacter tunicatorum]|uniref:Probable transcriptional regulatory protein HNQ88_004944 n=1 Tax=Aureibacter tunicatorum TaxID=866807 RepID=A0AAE4BVG2_9BACT|nr:YebC/PmpR family DNA-binding transcriptional regulator [Aureibacter tunicatorum]MDR6241857.1 YebC/PmpR family DNA-binding regulatory protein [Aureibacter tunicatorum]BDD07104.1 putative transcriptional regulatory protein [Aureibacter tunicatorum]
MGRAFEYRRAAKEKRWDKMSKIFPRLAKTITLAAKEGGPDPEMNAKLRTAIQTAKAQNMPKDNIENAIKRATSKDMENFTEVIYEGKGPHGVLVVVECATDNGNRTVANVKSYFNKAGGGVVPNGSLEYMFNRKSVFEFEKPEDFDAEEFEFALIDAGLEEMEIEDENIIVYGDFTNFGTIAKELENLGVNVTKASLKRIPTSPVDFTEEQLVDIEKMLDKIEDDDDIQQVFTNIA